MNDTTQLEKVRAEMVRRHENDLERAAQRIEELEAQLAAKDETIAAWSNQWREVIRERDAARAEARVLAHRVGNMGDFWDWETKEKDLEIASKYRKDGEQ